MLSFDQLITYIDQNGYPQIKNFLILCETLNFRKASGQINIVQPALSRQMQLLEKEATRILQDLNKTIIRAAQLQELRRFITMF